MNSSPTHTSLKKVMSFFKKKTQPHSGPRVAVSSHLEMQVVALLQQNDITRPAQEIKSYLRLLQNDVCETVEQLTCLSLAEVGILIQVSSSNRLRGVENSSGSSCYIDTILFAMFSQETAFDCLLQSRPLKTPEANILQTHCRFFVNLLRTNNLIRAQTVEAIRSQLIKCGWGASKNSQEDAVEFFLFLTGVFELPFLPLNVQLFHGAIEDAAVDDKFTADRVLALSLPPIVSPTKLPKSRPSNLSLVSGISEISEFPRRDFLSVESLLLDYFCSNRIQGIRRSLYSTHQSDSEKVAVTDAWSVLKLLPFYTSQNELGVVSEIRESELTDPDLVLPLMIKRYSQAADGTFVRDSRHIAIPTEIDFNNFVKRLDDGITDRSQKEYRLQLKAVVCHVGTSLQSGHYIVYVRDTATNDWLQLDDLSQDKVRRFTTVRSATRAFEKMGRNAYLLLYKLTTEATSSRKTETAAMDARYARKMQIRELSNFKGTSCPVQ